jgi:hypothetical protein
LDVRGGTPRFLWVLWAWPISEVASLETLESASILVEGRLLRFCDLEVGLISAIGAD